MKAITEKSNKSNKRSQALKGILEKQGIEHIPEDLIKGVIEIAGQTSSSRMVSFGAGVINKSDSSAASIPQSIALFSGLIVKELGRAATGLGIDEGELKAWVDLQMEVPSKTILTLLRMMQTLHLDPLCEEIGFTQYDDGQWQVFITIEGCSKLLNQHPQFPTYDHLYIHQQEISLEAVGRQFPYLVR